MKITDLTPDNTHYRRPSWHEGDFIFFDEYYELHSENMSDALTLLDFRADDWVIKTEDKQNVA